MRRAQLVVLAAAVASLAGLLPAARAACGAPPPASFEVESCGDLATQLDCIDTAPSAHTIAISCAKGPLDCTGLYLQVKGPAAVTLVPGTGCSAGVRPRLSTARFDAITALQHLFIVAGPSALLSLQGVDLDLGGFRGGVKALGGAGARVALSGVSIRNGLAVPDGGALFLTNTSATIAGSELVNCQTGGRGGGVLAAASGPFALKATLKVTSTRLASLTAGQDGGGFYLSNVKAALTAINASATAATNGNGGFLFASVTTGFTATAVVLTALTIDSASAGGGSGGAALLDRAAAAISGSRFTNCHAAADGGAVYATSQDKFPPKAKLLTLKNTRFESCSADGNGGALYLAWATASLTNVAANTVHAFDSGGFIYAQNSNGAAGRAVKIKGCAVEGASAHWRYEATLRTEPSGGGLYLLDTYASVASARFDGCAADQGSGGAINLKYTQAFKATKPLAFMGKAINMTNGLSCIGGGGLYIEKSTPAAVAVTCKSCSFINNDRVCGRRGSSRGGSALWTVRKDDGGAALSLAVTGAVTFAGNDNHEGQVCGANYAANNARTKVVIPAVNFTACPFAELPVLAGDCSEFCAQ